MNIIIDDRIDVLLNCLHFILSNILHTVAKVASTESDTVTEKRGNANRLLLQASFNCPMMRCKECSRDQKSCKERYSLNFS